MSVDDKLDKLDSRLDDIDKTLIRQEGHLKDHIRRTELLEEEVHPIKAHVHQLRGATKLVVIVSSLVGLVALFYKG
jgi:hypothetical protein